MVHLLNSFRGTNEYKIDNKVNTLSTKRSHFLFGLLFLTTKICVSFPMGPLNDLSPFYNRKNRQVFELQFIFRWPATSVRV